MLEVRDLALAWPGASVPVFADLSLDVRAGEFVAILGANGSGKTTLLRCLVRLLSPTAGSIVIDGREMVGLGADDVRLARRNIASITQRANLIKRRSVLANVATGALGRRRDWRTALGILAPEDLALASDCLREVGLEELGAQRADTLSGGEAQRVAIARALAQRPRLLLADEPVANLDPQGTDDVLRLLKRLAHEAGLGVLCVLHQPDLARRYCDRIVGLRDGRIVFDAPPDAVAGATVDSLYRIEAA